jgi:hypothetical protein
MSIYTWKMLTNDNPKKFGIMDLITLNRILFNK